LAVPEHLKNVHLRTAGEGKKPNSTYVYPHDHQGHHVGQEYVPTANRYYEPDGQGYERTILSRMNEWASVEKRGEDESK